MAVEVLRSPTGPGALDYPHRLRNLPSIAQSSPNTLKPSRRRAPLRTSRRRCMLTSVAGRTLGTLQPSGMPAERPLVLHFVRAGACRDEGEGEESGEE